MEARADKQSDQQQSKKIFSPDYDKLNDLTKKYQTANQTANLFHEFGKVSPAPQFYFDDSEEDEFFSDFLSKFWAIEEYKTCTSSIATAKFLRKDNHHRFAIAPACLGLLVLTLEDMPYYFITLSGIDNNKDKQKIYSLMRNFLVEYRYKGAYVGLVGGDINSANKKVLATANKNNDQINANRSCTEKIFITLAIKLLNTHKSKVRINAMGTCAFYCYPENIDEFTDLMAGYDVSKEIIEEGHDFERTLFAKDNSELLLKIDWSNKRSLSIINKDDKVIVPTAYKKISLVNGYAALKIPCCDMCRLNKNPALNTLMAARKAELLEISPIKNNLVNRDDLSSETKMSLYSTSSVLHSTARASSIAHESYFPPYPTGGEEIELEASTAADAGAILMAYKK